MNKFVARLVKIEDFDVVRKLAKSNKNYHFCLTTEDIIHNEFDTETPIFQAYVLEIVESQIIIGYAISYIRFSCLSREIYLEDLHIEPGYNNKKLGVLLMKLVATHGTDIGCSSLILTCCTRYNYEYKKELLMELATLETTDSSDYTFVYFDSGELLLELK